MNKIDDKLLNFVILSEKDCVLNGIVYYNDKQKTQEFFYDNNIKILKELNFINALAVCFTSENVLKVASQSFICYISSVAEVETFLNVSKKILGCNKFSLSGKGVNIAFIDTGISSHLDFKLKQNKLLKFIDFVNSKTKNYDDNGHGTFVASVATGGGYLSGFKYSGIAYNSNIVALKALDGKGEANAVLILDAMQWVYDNHKKYNIKIVCMSFGSEPLGINDPIMIGAEKLWDEGVIVVCAGGNSGPEKSTIKSPGISKKIITVGGLDDKRTEDDQYDEKNFDIASFSSRGPAMGRIKPDLIAPSVNITACNYLGGYKKMNGTSVATPMVAGICALILEKYPNAKPEHIKKFLLYNAKTIKKTKFEEGYGIANINNLL